MFILIYIFVMIHVLCRWFTSDLEFRASHPPELAVDRVYFLDQGDQDGVTDPLQKTQIDLLTDVFSFSVIFYVQ